MKSQVVTSQLSPLSAAASLAAFRLRQKTRNLAAFVCIPTAVRIFETFAEMISQAKRSQYTGLCKKELVG